MSRIGRQPVAIPAGVTVSIEGDTVSVKGPLGNLKQQIDKNIKVNIDKNTIHLTRNADDDALRAKHGLYKALIANMVHGVTKGYEKSLIVNGVGYKAQVQGTKLVLNIGFSHPVEYQPENGIKIECPTINDITVKGISKEAVGQAAADIRALKIPDPYYLYGIRYKDEIIQKKEGKTAGK
jgi:large subunit ribosomal protein L6